MKRLIIVLAIALTAITTPALAAETTTVPTTDITNTATDTSVLTTDTTVLASDTTVPTTGTTAPTVDTSPSTIVTLPDAGLTPDSPFYFIDKLIEKIQLVLTSEENRANLLESFAQERLSEAQAVQNINEKTQLVNEYINTVNQVKGYIDTQVSAGKDISPLVASVKGGSTRGIEILKSLAQNTNNPGLQNAINKQEEKLAEHLIFAELKQQMRTNKQAIDGLEEKIAAAKAAGQNVDDLEKQLAELKAKEDLLKDTKKVLKRLKKEAKNTYKLNIKDEDENIDNQDKQIEVDNNKQLEENMQLNDEQDNLLQGQDKEGKIERIKQKEERKLERAKQKEERKIEREKNKEDRKIIRDRMKEERKNNKEKQNEERKFNENSNGDEDQEN